MSTPDRVRLVPVARPLAALALAVGLVVGIGACGPAAPTAPASPAAPSTAAGPVPVVIDTDMSTDDTVAIPYLLRDPGVDVRAITVVGTGLVHCGAGMQTVTNIVATLGIEEMPTSCGRTEPLPGGHPFPDEWRAAADRGYGLQLEPRPVTGIPLDAPALLRSLAAVSERKITVLALGPMTNLADAFAADPALAGRIERIVAMAGAIDVPGNVDLGQGAGPAEWNVYADPAAFDAVLRAGVPITLVPLDATNAVPVTQAFVDELGRDHAAAAADVAYELFLRHGVVDGEYFWDALAAVALLHEDVVTFEELPLEVVTDEGPESGRLRRADGGTTVRAATAADREAFERRFLEGLRRGAPREHPFQVAATLEVRFDGTACDEQRPASPAAGLWRFAVESSQAPAAVTLLRFHDGAGWADLEAFVASNPSSDDEPAFLDAVGWVSVEHAGGASAMLDVGPGRYAVACLFDDAGAPGVVLGEGEFTVGP